LTQSTQQYGNWVENKKYDEDGGLNVFGSYADDYDNFRPTYPSAFWTDLTKDLELGTAVDLCAGTGRGAKELLNIGFSSVIAIDADKGMLGRIEETMVRSKKKV